jgi:hypothetical protein
LLGSRPAPRVICCNRNFALASAVKLGEFHRLLLELSTDVAVRSSEAWRRPVGLNWTAVGEARPVYTSALRVSVPRGSRWLRMRSMAVTSRGSFATLKRHTCMHQYPLFDVKAFRMKIWARRNTPSGYCVLSATRLTCAPYHATVSGMIIRGHMYLIVMLFVGTWEQKTRSNPAEAKCRRTHSINAVACRAETIARSCMNIPQAMEQCVGALTR